MIGQPATSIYKDHDFYIPAFEVKVGEEPLKRDVMRDILSVSYKDGLNEIDSFEITINNWDAQERTFKYSNDHLFDPGRKIELWMGYHAHLGSKGDLRLMLTGEITALRPSFPAQGQPTLVVSGLNLLHKLRNRQVSKSYLKMTDNEIAAEIGGEARLNVRIDTTDSGPAQTIRHAYLFQDNTYDILFLLTRARRIGYDLFVVEDGLNGSARPSRLVFKPSTDVGEQTFDLKYGLTLIEFSPEFATANQVGRVTVKGWDAVRKKPISQTVTRDDLKTRGVKKGQESQIEASFADREEIVTDKPVNSEAEARQLARETLQRIAKEMVKGNGSVVGIPELRTGCFLNISGMGRRFDGRYFVTGTTHAIGDGGYTTRFDCRMEES